MITAQMVKDLRERTGAGVMNCKKALTEADGNMDKAIEILREKGLSAAAKKAGRVASEGIIVTYINDDKKNGAIVEVNCETDFVAANDEFITLSKNIAKQVALSNVSDLESLNGEKYVADDTITVKDAVIALIAKLGENMNIRRFEKFSAPDGMICSYVHGNGRIGVLVQVKCDTVNDVVAQVAKDVAMQVAATNPLFLDKDSVNNESLEKEKEIYRVQALNEGKPEKIIEKMIMGRIQKYYKENCLIEQVWVRDADYTIKKYVDEKSKEIGSPITIVKFVRYERGEGIEKKVENFAEEVQKQMQQG